MIKLEFNTNKNLLAFSAGIDSSALFFILLENNIPFDLAIVNYNIREQSKKEILYAQELALKYNKKCFIKNVFLDDKSNFEQEARNIRYSFFEELISKHSYKRLFTAHQLDDKLEWFLMQLSKGAGLLEILGINENEKKENYYLTRPLLNVSKKSLLEYLNKNSFKYFIDESNLSSKYTRNKMRHEFSTSFLNKYEKGVKKSFLYLHKDLSSLKINKEALFKEKDLEIFRNLNDDNLNIRIIDYSLKKRGLLLSKKQRDEILKQKDLVVSHCFSISIEEKFIYIAKETKETMPKEFKEKCRVLKIPANIRAYIYKEDISLENILKSLR
ncbi:MAG: tRNA lysidine(34) synthetase TilS [Campylobacteraceae bacterium]|nr:tRNA lysidine(34) synthetase TilS [Campylobacteraceae bacterium]